LLYGVSEREGALSAKPFALAGESERIEQIAVHRLDPPLAVRVFEIPTKSDLKLGYLLVQVPPSPEAPHMVEGQYWARAERTKYRMSDAEVVRIHRSRDVAEDRVADALEEERARNPQPDPGGRAMLVAIPLNGRRNLARNFVRGEQMRVIELSRSAEQGLPASLRFVRTSPPSLTNYEVRAVGLAGTDLRGAGRTVGAADEGHYATDIEVSESGEIRILASGVVQHLGLPNGVSRPAIFESVLIAWVHRLIAWAATLADEFGYTGAWGFGVTAAGLECNGRLMSSTA
jgi:hypothetical protein